MISIYFFFFHLLECTILYPNEAHGLFLFFSKQTSFAKYNVYFDIRIIHKT